MLADAMSSKTLIVIADDHPVMLLGLRGLLAQFDTVEIAGMARNSTEIIALLDRRPCDILLTDFVMPGGAHGDGMHMLELVRKHYPALWILVVTMLDNPGPLGKLARFEKLSVVSKLDDASHIATALGQMLVGRRYLSPAIQALLDSATPQVDPRVRFGALSPREISVIRLYLTGMSVSQIAANLGRSIKTISTQKMSAMRKLGLRGDMDLFSYATSTGLLGQTLLHAGGKPPPEPAEGTSPP
ncbi:response regulator [Cupriavidus sp. 30B13]|uniref:response regulator n=1 Tax=Cupriavidus sp. 30B13 TaxID=3384241 RepID=UPI003B91FC52